jgi:DNA-binding Lrp family transcriptional regulator
VSSRLDATDLAILREMQADGRITNVELARRVGMSAPPCLRRVRALEEAGYIKDYRARLNAKKIGFDVSYFAMVHLDSQAEKDLTAFEASIREWPVVRQCWTLSGDIDFLLMCVVPDLGAFQSFVSDLSALPNVKNIRTALTLDQVKDEPLLPLKPRRQ